MEDEQGNVQIVPEDSKREDGDGERIASIASVTAEEFGDNLVVVFWAPSDMHREQERPKATAKHS